MAERQERARERGRERARGPRCPICNEPTDAHYRPFCSKRCADVDLGRWVTGAYSLPAEEEDDPDEEARAAAEAAAAGPFGGDTLRR